MRRRYRMLAVYLSIVVATPTGAAAADCSQAIEQVQTDARAFQAEAERQGLKAAMDASLEPAVNLARNNFGRAGGPNAEALQELTDARDKLQSFRERVGALDEFLSSLSACLRGGPPGCLSQLAGTVNAENRAYIQGLAGEDSAAAAQRVDKAASFLNDYTSRLNGAAQGNALSAMDCMDARIEQLAQSGQGPVSAPERTPQADQSAPPTEVKPKGGGAGKLIAVTLGVVAVGAVAGAVARNAGATGGSCDAGYASCKSPGGGGANVCCPVAAPYYCASDNGCRSDVMFSCPSGKIFCTADYN